MSLSVGIFPCQTQMITIWPVRGWQPSVWHLIISVYINNFCQSRWAQRVEEYQNVSFRSSCLIAVSVDSLLPARTPHSVVCWGHEEPPSGPDDLQTKMQSTDTETTGDRWVADKHIYPNYKHFFLRPSYSTVFVFGGRRSPWQLFTHKDVWTPGQQFSGSQYWDVGVIVLNHLQDFIKQEAQL